MALGHSRRRTPGRCERAAAPATVRVLAAMPFQKRAASEPVAGGETSALSPVPKAVLQTVIFGLTGGSKMRKIEGAGNASGGADTLP
jgi:hypothetical protein